MTPQQKSNIIPFFVVLAILSWVVYKQMVVPVQQKIKVTMVQLEEIDTRAQSGENLVVKTARISQAVDEAKPSLDQIFKHFPEADKGQTRVSQLLGQARAEFPGVHVAKQPALTRKDFTYKSVEIPNPEDVNTVFKTLLPLNTAPKPMEGGTIITNVLKLTRFDQEWTIESDWDSFVKFLDRLGKQSLFFEVTSIDMWAGQGSKDKVKSTLIVSTVGLVDEPVAPPKN